MQAKHTMGCMSDFVARQPSLLWPLLHEHDHKKARFKLDAVRLQPDGGGGNRVGRFEYGQGFELRLTG